MLFATWRRLIRLPELPQYSPHPDARSSRCCYWQVLTAVTVGVLLVWGIMPRAMHARDQLQDKPLPISFRHQDSSILIFQHFNLHDDRVHVLQNISMNQHRRYAELWGYQYVTSTFDAVPQSDTVRQRQMNKIYALMAVMLEELEKGDGVASWIMICDADTLVVNPLVPIHALIPDDNMLPSPPPLILGTSDWNGFNSGVMMYRCHLDTVAFLSQALTLSDDITREYLKAAETGSTAGMETPPSDQRAVCLVLEKQQAFRSRFYRYPQHWLNNYDLPSDKATLSLHIHLVADNKYQHNLSPYLNAERNVLHSMETENVNLDRVVEDYKEQASAWWLTGDLAMPKCIWI